MRKRQPTLLMIAGAVVLIVGGIATYVIFNKSQPSTKQAPAVSQKSDATQSHHTYSLNLVGNPTYSAASSSKLTLDIRDENNTILKNFDIVNQQPLQIVVIRKDRTNYQSLTPEYNTSTGLFTIPNFTLPTDGEYRLFADFTPSDAQKDDMGVKLASTPYKDLKVGSETNAPPQSEDEKLTSTVRGFDTTLSLLEGDSPGIPTAYAGLPLPIAISINRNKVPYTDLQPSDGLLGRMVVISPGLQLIPVTRQPDATTLQTGLLVFSASFPDAGLYKIYVQVKANNQVQTFDYNFTVKPMPGSQSHNTQTPSKGNQ